METLVVPGSNPALAKKIVFALFQVSFDHSALSCDMLELRIMRICWLITFDSSAHNAICNVLLMGIQ